MALELKIGSMTDSPKYYEMNENQKTGLIEIWGRCIERWKRKHKKESIPSAFLEMTLFIEELKDRL